jgi:HTH-type transcriptional regulator/antitoxin MqsA
MINCPLCNGTTIKKIVDTPFEYKGKTTIIKQPQSYCEACNEGFLSHQDILATKKELADFRREQDGLLRSNEIKTIRKKIGLTQEKAAELFGGGVRAFHKYETGEIIQSKPLDTLLRLLQNNVIDLGAISRVSKGAKHILF